MTSRLKGLLVRREDRVMNERTCVSMPGLLTQSHESEWGILSGKGTLDRENV